MSVRFVLFDAFGTLLRIPKARHPYRMILKAGISQGRRPEQLDIRQVMTRNLDLTEAAKHFGISISPSRMSEIQAELDAELCSAEPFDDGLRAVEMLQSQGIKVAVASNLAAPYAELVRRMYPTMDAYGFSFSIGAMKPDTCNKFKQVTEAPRSTSIQMMAFETSRPGPFSITLSGISNPQDLRPVQLWVMTGYKIERGADLLVHGRIRFPQSYLGTKRVAIKPRQQISDYGNIRAAQIRAHTDSYFSISQQFDSWQRVFKRGNRLDFDVEGSLELTELGGGQLDFKKIGSPCNPQVLVMIQRMSSDDAGRPWREPKRRSCR